MFEKNSYLHHFVIIAFFASSIFVVHSCTKPEKEFAVIKGTVNHHEWEVPGVKVYLKKNAKDFPGFNSEIYDDSTIATSNVFYKAPFVFRYLEPGDYYLMAKGFDTVFNMPVKGAWPVSIQTVYDIKDVIIPVNE